MGILSSEENSAQGLQKLREEVIFGTAERRKELWWVEEVGAESG